MKRFLTCGLGLLFLSFSAPRAYAQGGGWGWLERLSGPGPFQGYEVSFDFCLVSEETVKENGSVEVTKPLTMAVAWSSKCLGLDRKKENVTKRYKHEGSFNVAYARLTSQENILEYPTGVTEEEKKIVVYQVSPSIDMRLNRTLDVGVGATLHWFTGDLFDTFLRVSVDLFRVRWTPLTLFGEKPGRRWLQLDVKGSYFPGEFSAQDFGSSGQFASSNELRPRVSVVIDFIELAAALALSSR